MASVTISGVGKRYGAVAAVRDVSVEVADGEFVILVGPSGCGKSTLLRMVAGLESITDGRIAIGGRPVNDLAPKDRDVAMVFQNYALYPHMSVENNMAFSLRLRGVGRPGIAERVGRAAGILGLGALLRRQPRALSGGQRQRVAMGRAIVRDPAVFLFDEPLSNLDAKLRVRMRSEIKQLHRRLRTTTIYVTHDQVEAMTMADRIVVMRDGAVEQVGAPLELYDRPANTFVAGFIGSPAMNLLAGEAAPEGFRLADGTVLPLGGAGMGSAMDATTYGIRPEHLLLDPEGGLPAEVVVVEPMGSETQVEMRLGGQPLTGVFRQRIAEEPGSVLRVSPDLSAVHLFDGRGVRVG